MTNRQLPGVPKAIGPYSPAVAAGGFLFTSGQLGADENGALPADVRAQTDNALRNLCAVLALHGLTTAQVVKTTVFVKDLNDFAAVNEVYATFFSEGAYPARSCVQGARLPKDALVEVEAVAAFAR